MAIRYQEANALQIGYLQQAIYNMIIHTFNIRNVRITALNTIFKIKKDCIDVMDWKWTTDPEPVANLTTYLGNKIRKGKRKLTSSEDHLDAADRAIRSRRGGTVPPPTMRSSLSSSQNTGYKWRTTLTSRKGSGCSASPKKPREPSTGGALHYSSNNSDSDLSDNKGELLKKKVTSKQLLNKYVKAMA